MSEPWLTSLKTEIAQARCGFASTLSRMSVKAAQPSDEVLGKLRVPYDQDTARVIAKELPDCCHSERLMALNPAETNCVAPDMLLPLQRGAWVIARLIRIGRGGPILAVLSVLSACWPGVAWAHVKWFAPYIVGAPPMPVTVTLRNGWFWLGIGLVVALFVMTRLVERGRNGDAVLDGLDRLTQPMWGRLDDYVRAIVAAFFVAIFSVGGVYLTPDLKTPAEWVSWMQLLIAALIFWRVTMPLAGAGIVVLWLLALRDYDLFHLFDYLALGLGIAAYLVLAAVPNEEWRRHRFEALRWGLAFALMWSSLEKFAYPEWFYPLVEEKPFLTFGLPRDAFIPMAGVAEFTMGFGLLWTPLIRRLSALALLVIFTSAVWPFGRIEIIGHGLIMAILLAVAADHGRRQSAVLAALEMPVRNIPIGLAAALLISASSYWGLHLAFYGPNGHIGQASPIRSTHSHNPDHPDGPTSDGIIGAPPTKTAE